MPLSSFSFFDILSTTYFMKLAYASTPMKGNVQRRQTPCDLFNATWALHVTMKNACFLLTHSLYCLMMKDKFRRGVRL
jgi:hypothetical protein